MRDSVESALESEPAPASGFGLNGINRTGQSTTMQLNAQGLTGFDARGVVQHVAVGSRLDDRIATVQRRVRTEGAQARSLGGYLLARRAEMLGGVSHQSTAGLTRQLTVLSQPPDEGQPTTLVQSMSFAEQRAQVGRE